MTTSPWDRVTMVQWWSTDWGQAAQIQPRWYTSAEWDMGQIFHPQRKPISIKVTAHAPRPWLPPVYFVSMGLLIWDISFKWNAQYMALYIWLLLLSIMFSRFICIVACFSTSCLFTVE